MLIAFKAFL